jgi:glycosyltransferase involved in cell wall biosynthesis
MRRATFAKDLDKRDFCFDIRSYDEIHGITLCAIVLNEEKNIVEFINHHKPYVRDIVIIDGGSNDTTMELAIDHANVLKKIAFSGHYGNQKNRAIEQAVTDWVLFVDADERFNEKSLKSMNELINQNEFDAYAFPRKNFINDSYDDEHYPDYQTRLFRSYCRYIRPIHEELVGFHNRKELGDDMAMVHSKEFNRHLNRNSAYDSFACKYINEMGKPGVQDRKLFIEKYKKFLDGGK